MKFNLLITFLAAFIPMLVGTVWYNPKVFGNAWMQANGFTKDDLDKSKMGLIFGLSFLFAIILSVQLNTVVIHQFGVTQTLQQHPELLQQILSEHANHFRSFGHGVLHGIVFSLFTVLPIIGTHALYEKKSFKYVAIHVGYWLVNFALMGGVICEFS